MRRLAMLATAMAIPALGLSACGGSSKTNTTGGSEKDQVLAVVKAFNLDPPSLCEKYATPALIKGNFGNKATCLAKAKSPGAKDPHYKVVKVKLKPATAVVVTAAGVQPGKGTKEEVDLIKQGGSWKVDAIVPA